MNPKPHILCCVLIAAPFVSASALADESSLDSRQLSPADIPSLATSGSSGALNVPDGRILPDGAVVLGLNNSLGREFSNYHVGQNYQFGIGLFRYVELSGRLANYPINGAGEIGLRDLSANIKVAIPKLFRDQPDIAIGMNDVGGGAPNFQSKYIAVSQSFGPVRFTAGAARGRPYLGRYFGSTELALWDTGASVLVERNGHMSDMGLRFGSRPFSLLGNARIIATAQRTIGASKLDGRTKNRSALGINVLIPFGDNARDQRRIAPENEPIWTPPAPRSALIPGTAMAVDGVTAPAGPASAATVDQAIAGDVSSIFKALRAELIKAGLERVRVGQRGAELIIEYENHRYNRNEVDAIGIALGAGVMRAPLAIRWVSAVTKKAGLSLYKVSVERARYRQFLRDGDYYEVQSDLTFAYRPTDDSEVQWIDQEEGPRGYSRVKIDPQLVKFVGTELGVFDYSLAANIQAFVPLWKGAELTTSYIATIDESENVAHGFLGYAQQQNGLKSAVISQSLWLTGQIFNTLSVGRFLYNANGLQNETTWFVPGGRADQGRLQYTRLAQPDGYRTRIITTGSVSYLLNYSPLNVSVETGYNRYVGGDTGPSVQLNRWFGDVQAQLYIRKSNIESRVGFGLAFPLTPRQGMRPGLIHIEGAGSFPFKVETKLAKAGQCNCITNGVVGEMPLVYSSRSMLFNNGRLGNEYFIGQLPRLREAALIFGASVQE